MLWQTSSSETPLSNDTSKFVYRGNITPFETPVSNNTLNIFCCGNIALVERSQSIFLTLFFRSQFAELTKTISKSGKSGFTILRLFSSSSSGVFQDR